ncbi:sigma 54 modulation/S30EA ribosomal C-terminal domain-containing protein [Spirilliplanes yamanashiensis]|uniref:Sigma 54 modulation/S30EA ribosomal protein C-terminal domain-containing protein n=1 Tax=Spirilliplanes yamanashiensis TaxID=42233 RepID=A0A8J3Y7Y9_9ACTN|nr:sigma 54 modulation/S30EA ribosomal C-terminal domain-containing protein [Spirilliplanes yamanashiensis]MDP9817265.1 hypothetical protein [Spirilliplanes yamanashiensis]GIJ03082.1 hypothetical protein Sya03_24340 [Spirilliplanes yamanashiensis]
MPDSRASGLAVAPDAVIVRGRVSSGEMSYAEWAVAGLPAGGEPPARDTIVRISGYAGRPPFVVAQIRVVAGGVLVRSQVAASTATDAVDRAVAGMRARLDRLRRGAPGGTRPPLRACGPPPELVAASAGPARLVRIKECRLAVRPPAAAAFTMDLRDYPFHLFTEAATRRDGVVHTDGGTGYRVLEEGPALDVPAAVDALGSAPGRPFLFFTDPATGRGRVLYRRYDGNVALIRPRAERSRG